MSKICSICGEPLESGIVVHPECVPQSWISAKERLPECEEGEGMACLVCLVDMVERGAFRDDELIRTVVEAVFLTKQKLWLFHPEAFDGYTHDPVNALVGEQAFIGEDGEWLDVGSFVSHWMPMPKLPEV